MRILLTGAAGMIGKKLSASLLADALTGREPLSALILHDVVPPELPVPGTGSVAGSVTGAGTGAGTGAVPGARQDPGPSGRSMSLPLITLLGGDLAAPGAAAALMAHRPDVIFHLAGVVSAQAEADVDLGYSVNLDGTRALFEAARAQTEATGRAPRIVYASSIAVFGAPFPDVIPDDFAPRPLTSYGTQKLIGELLLADFSRRGYIDGVGLRLPTICVRPGAPNRAASGFFSGIIREPLAGLPARLPVSRDVVHLHASPRAAVGFMRHAAMLDTSTLGAGRNLTLPGVSISVGGQIAALSRLAGAATAALISDDPDPVIAGIVAGWAQAVSATRARALGFTADADFDAIIRAHAQDAGITLPG